MKLPVVCLGVCRILSGRCWEIVGKSMNGHSDMKVHYINSKNPHLIHTHHLTLTSSSHLPHAPTPSPSLSPSPHPPQSLCEVTGLV